MKKTYQYTKYNKNLKEFSRDLRKNMTKQERKLWFCFLKDYPIKFTRQKPLGSYIADFYCAKAKTVIELDGSQHYEDEALEYDKARTEALNSLGIEIIRFSNYDVDTNFEGVCLMIDKKITSKTGISNFYEE